jgi:hypothetical protein
MAPLLGGGLGLVGVCVGIFFCVPVMGDGMIGDVRFFLGGGDGEVSEFTP